jgi:trehalose synthase
VYGTLALSHKALDDLAEYAGAAAIDELRALARPIEGLRVLNLSVTAFGTGTAELLNSSVPLLTDLGLDCHWQVVRASDEDAPVTRAMYQALGGNYVSWTQEMTADWLRYASVNAALLNEPFDVIIVHDPQPAALRSFVPEPEASKWVFHSHLDLSSAQDDVWLLLRSHVEKYDAAIFEAQDFIRGDLTLPVRIIPPAIDPTSARNMPLPDEMIRTVLERYGMDPALPMVLQISPCDAESDMTGVVDACCKVRDRFGELQVAIVLMTQPQDPAGRACYEDLTRRCAHERGVFLLNMGQELGNVEINVLQRAASVVLQKGLRKGFGLWVGDALWKERPVVASSAHGLRELVVHEETGLVAGSTDEVAEAISRLLDDRALAARLGAQGRRHIGRKFLITRYLRDYVQLLTEVHRS